MKDNYGRDINYMRISVTELCNLRCRYCMPECGIVKRSHDDMMHMDEFLTAAKAAAALGIRKIRVTGGEPLVKRGLIPFLSQLSAIDGISQLCITTNGTLLEEKARALKEAGVTRLNISLDTLRADRFADITRIGDLDTVLRGIAAAKAAGFDDIRINAVLIKGFNDDEIADFARLTVDEPIDVRFIELMPIGDGLDADDLEYLSCQAVLDALPELEALGGTESDDAPEAAGGYDGVARMYRLPGARGRVGLIRPLSCEFCSGCNKIRLTADGMLKPCLHLQNEISIKGLSEVEMREVMRKAILEKPPSRDILDANNRSKAGRSMNRIGG